MPKTQIRSGQMNMLEVTSAVLEMLGLKLGDRLVIRRGGKDLELPLDQFDLPPPAP